MRQLMDVRSAVTSAEAASREDSNSQIRSWDPGIQESSESREASREVNAASSSHRNANAGIQFRRDVSFDLFIRRSIAAVSGPGEEARRQGGRGTSGHASPGDSPSRGMCPGPFQEIVLIEPARRR